VHFSELTAPEQRVLGCLIEKRWTTPDQYPLSLNALRLACNQATNRDPVTHYDDSTVRDAAQRLSRYGLARLASGHSSRAIKYRHLAEEALNLDRPQLAILGVLLLRGPQTPGELKNRSERMAPLASLSEVDRVLGELGERGYARRLVRRPGQKEDRYEHLLGGDGDGAPGALASEPWPAPASASASSPELAPAPASAPASSPEPGPAPASAPASSPEPGPVHASAPASSPEPPLEPRVAALEAQVQRLRAELDELRDQLGG
jgi:uncharacterized protein YceH (UPF0502 family)